MPSAARRARTGRRELQQRKQIFSHNNAPRPGRFGSAEVSHCHTDRSSPLWTRLPRGVCVAVAPALKLGSLPTLQTGPAEPGRGRRADEGWCFRCEGQKRLPGAGDRVIIGAIIITALRSSRICNLCVTLC